MEDGRDNYADILEELDPLPELPETGDDRFFTKDALDFQYTTGPAENNPLFPTWGSTGAEMAAIGAAAAANAMTTPPAAATTASPSSSPTPPAPVAAASPSKASSRSARGGGGGKKRALPNSSQEPAHPGQGGRSSRGRILVARTAAAAATAAMLVPSTSSTMADRTVFLRERLGGESVSSGNSSTSAGSGSSDNGSASEDVAGGWEGGVIAKENGNGKRKRCGVTRRAKKPFMRSGAAAAAANAPSAAAGAAAAVAAPPAAGASASHAPTKAGLRTRYGGSSTKSSRRRHRKSRGRGGGGGSDGSSCSVAGGSTTSSVSSRSSRSRGGGSRSNSIDAGAYASWDSLVKPLKQQWDHVEGPPAAALSAGVGSKLGSSPLASGGVCSVFSAEPRPNSTTAFSVEQCSAQAHPMAVASYVLRVRCAGGAHIVRRTWDDVVSLCTMLSRELARSPPEAAATEPAAAGAAAAASASSTEGGIDAGKTAAAAGAGAGAAVEFTPADVLAHDAASGFLKDILSRPGTACSTPVRRFLELEYLDGTLRGGLVDHSRANAARQVACLAALTTAAAAAASAAQGAFAVGDKNAAAAATAAPPGAETTPATTSSSGDSGDAEPRFDVEQPPSVVAPRPSQSLPAHPDAARDLAAVCRCLGELGASAFTPAPSSSVPAAFRGAAPYWSAVGEEAAAPGRGDDGASVAPQRGVALLA